MQTKRTRSKIDPGSEDFAQIQFCAWLTKNDIRCYAIPNGGYRNYWEAVKLKRLGVKAGVPDICIPIPTKTHHGLYIELKRPSGGKVSELQTDWINYLRSVGYRAEVANGFEEAKKIVMEYLDMDQAA